MTTTTTMTMTTTMTTMTTIECVTLFARKVRRELMTSTATRRQTCFRRCIENNSLAIKQISLWIIDNSFIVCCFGFGVSDESIVPRTNLKFRLAICSWNVILYDIFEFFFCICICFLFILFTKGSRSFWSCLCGTLASNEIVVFCFDYFVVDEIVLQLSSIINNYQ